MMLVTMGDLSQAMLERYRHIRMAGSETMEGVKLPTLRKPAQGGTVEAASAAVARESHVAAKEMGKFCKSWAVEKSVNY